MSKGALANKMQKMLKVIEYYDKEEMKRYMGQRSSIRYQMDKNVSILEIDPENIQKGTRLITKGAEDSSDNSDRITIRQAILISKAANVFYSKKYGGRYKEVDLANAQIKAMDSPRSWVYVGVFKIKYIPTANGEKVVYIGVNKPFYIPSEVSDSGLFIGDNFGILRTSSSNFAKTFSTFVNNHTKRTKFLEVFTIRQLLGKSTKSRDDMDLMFGSALSSSVGKYGPVIPKKLSSINVGHSTSATDTFKKSVSQGVVESQLDKVALDSNVISQFISHRDLLLVIKELKEESKKMNDDIFYSFIATTTKNTSNLNKLKYIFEGAITFSWHSRTTNAANALGKGLSEFETAVKTKILSEKTIEKAITKLSANDLIHLRGSPSWLSGVLDTVTHKFMSGIKKAQNRIFHVKTPKTKPGTNTVTTAKVVMPTNKIKLANEQITAKRNVEFSAAKAYTPSLIIEIPEEQEESCMLPAGKLLAIKGRLQYEMHNAIKANMHLPALVYRTGRFAKSVKIAGVKQNSNCSITAYYRYMVAPYAVFDPSISSYKGLSSPTRNPQKIIGDSIRDIARSVMKDRYTIRPQWV